MSVLSRLEEERHYVIRSDEIENRLTRVESQLPLIVDQVIKGNEEKSLNRHVIVRSTLAGNFGGKNLSESVIVDSQLSGEFSGANLSETDIVDSTLKGNFVDCPNSGAYYRRCEITEATFNRTVPQQIQTDEIFIKKHTGIVIFCSRVEESMYQPEDVAVFMPVRFQINSAPDLNFLARLYFDGDRKKLGLVSSQDLLVINRDNEYRRLWSGFIYTLPREQIAIREAIINRMVSVNNLSDGFKIADPIDVIINEGPLILRPARPIDLSKIRMNQSDVHPIIGDQLRNLLH